MPARPRDKQPMPRMLFRFTVAITTALIIVVLVYFHSSVIDAFSLGIRTPPNTQALNQQGTEDESLYAFLNARKPFRRFSRGRNGDIGVNLVANNNPNNDDNGGGSLPPFFAQKDDEKRESGIFFPFFAKREDRFKVQSTEVNFEDGLQDLKALEKEVAEALQIAEQALATENEVKQTNKGGNRLEQQSLQRQADEMGSKKDINEADQRKNNPPTPFFAKKEDSESIPLLKRVKNEVKGIVDSSNASSIQTPKIFNKTIQTALAVVVVVKNLPSKLFNDTQDKPWKVGETVQESKQIVEFERKNSDFQDVPKAFVESSEDIALESRLEQTTTQKNEALNVAGKAAIATLKVASWMGLGVGSLAWKGSRSIYKNTIGPKVEEAWTNQFDSIDKSSETARAFITRTPSNFFYEDYLKLEITRGTEQLPVSDLSSASVESNPSNVQRESTPSLASDIAGKLSDDFTSEPTRRKSGTESKSTKEENPTLGLASDIAGKLSADFISEQSRRISGTKSKSTKEDNPTPSLASDIAGKLSADFTSEPTKRILCTEATNTNRDLALKLSSASTKNKATKVETGTAAVSLASERKPLNFEGSSSSISNVDYKSSPSIETRLSSVSSSNEKMPPSIQVGTSSASSSAGKIKLARIEEVVSPPVNNNEKTPTNTETDTSLASSSTNEKKSTSINTGVSPTYSSAGKTKLTRNEEIDSPFVSSSISAEKPIDIETVSSSSSSSSSISEERPPGDKIGSSSVPSSANKIKLTSNEDIVTVTIETVSSSPSSSVSKKISSDNKMDSSSVPSNDGNIKLPSVEEKGPPLVSSIVTTNKPFAFVGKKELKVKNEDKNDERLSTKSDEGIVSKSPKQLLKEIEEAEKLAKEISDTLEAAEVALKLKINTTNLDDPMIDINSLMANEKIVKEKETSLSQKEDDENKGLAGFINSVIKAQQSIFKVEPTEDSLETDVGNTQALENEVVESLEIAEQALTMASSQKQAKEGENNAFVVAEDSMDADLAKEIAEAVATAEQALTTTSSSMKSDEGKENNDFILNTVTTKDGLDAELDDAKALAKEIAAALEVAEQVLMTASSNSTFDGNTISGANNKTSP